MNPTVGIITMLMYSFLLHNNWTTSAVIIHFIALFVPLQLAGNRMKLFESRLRQRALEGFGFVIGIGSRTRRSVLLG